MKSMTFMQLDVKTLGRFGLVTLSAFLLSGCDKSGSEASTEGRVEAKEVPMLTMGTADPVASPANGEAPPPDGLVAAGSGEAVDPSAALLKGYVKDEDGKTLNIHQALQQAADTYLRLQPTSSVEDNQPMWPDLKDLNLLVKVGLIRGIPQAPAGQKWTIDDNYRVQLVPAQ